MSAGAPAVSSRAVHMPGAPHTSPDGDARSGPPTQLLRYAITRRRRCGFPPGDSRLAARPRVPQGRTTSGTAVEPILFATLEHAISILQELLRLGILTNTSCNSAGRFPVPCPSCSGGCSSGSSGSSIGLLGGRSASAMRYARSATGTEPAASERRSARPILPDPQSTNANVSVGLRLWGCGVVVPGRGPIRNDFPGPRAAARPWTG